MEIVKCFMSVKIRNSRRKELLNNKKYSHNYLIFIQVLNFDKKYCIKKNLQFSFEFCMYCFYF